MSPLQIEDPITTSMFFCLPIALSWFHSLVFPHPSLQTASPRSVNILGALARVQCETHSVNSVCRRHPRHPASGAPRDASTKVVVQHQRHLLKKTKIQKNPGHILK